MHELGVELGVVRNGGTNGSDPVVDSSSSGRLWVGVDRLVDRAPRLSDLRGHGLHLLAARRWRALGKHVPEDLHAEERAGAIVSLVGAGLLERVRAVCDGPLVLLKGPEVAAWYPDPTLRPFRDLDLLVPDPAAVQRALLSAGFEATGDPKLYEDIHHLRPLRWPGLPLLVEIHERPKWIDGIEPPATDELLGGAVPSRCGVDGILALPPAEHALVLAAHAWAHAPLSRLVHVIDIAATADGVDRRDLEILARRWEMSRVWRASRSAADSLLLGDRLPLSLRTWGRNLVAVRERTVLESHLEGWLCPWWALAPAPAAGQTARAIAGEFKPRPDETWRLKLKRVGRALLDAFERRSDHDRALERIGVPPPPKGGGR